MKYSGKKKKKPAWSSIKRKIKPKRIALKNRTPIKKKRKQRRGRVIDKECLAFTATQVCVVTKKKGCPCYSETCKNRITVHHYREYGSLKDDTKVIPLLAHLHMLGFEIPGIPCIERGKKVFEKFHRIDIKAEVELNRERYEAFKGTKS